MQLLNFTIIKLTIFFIAGILIGYFFPIELHTSLISMGIIFLLLLITYKIQKKQFKQPIWFGALTFIAMINTGVLTVNLHNQKNFSNHYSNYISEDTNELHNLIFRIREVLKPGNYYDKYVIEILNIDDSVSVGKSLLNIKKDNLSKLLTVDQTFSVRTEFKNLIHPLNPGQFDYKNYLKKKYIYHQLFADNNSLLKLETTKTTVFGLANSIRSHINSKLRRYNFEPDELAIINALLLGQRQDISETVYKSYTNAGAIHILAVSGLHIGIILIILNFLFKPLEQLKNGKLIKAGILISLLWSFAIIAGLSASVTRAVTMFSIVTLGLNLNRPTNIFNTLSISILVLLLFKPLFLFDVGFQLSYLAVFAIVVIDPIFYKLWQPKNWILDKYWHTITITFAAQFGIIPISLFYFHQFPGLFFLSNLVIIPFLGILLGLGILVILLAVLNALPQILASIFGSIIGWMNDFVGWVAHQEAFLFKDISFSLFYVLAFYLLIVSFFKLFFRKNYKNLRLFLFALVSIQCAFIYTEFSKPANRLVVFHKSRYSLIGNITQQHIEIANDFDSLTAVQNNIIRDYKVENHISTIKETNIPDFYLLNNKKLLIVDSLGIYGINNFKGNYILLRQSPKINLNRLIDSLNPKQIIADGSNYKSYVEQWEAICKKRKLPFHQTSKKGAFIIDY